MVDYYASGFFENFLKNACFILRLFKITWSCSHHANCFDCKISFFSRQLSFL